jgi:glutathione S-transferase
MTLQLYYTPVACSMVPYINLTEAQADFEVMPLNFSKGEHMSPEYLRLNPKHRVPVLMIDGEPLTESVAINPWIARTFPDAPDSEESVKQCAQKLLAEHFGIADALLAGREWFFDHTTSHPTLTSSGPSYVHYASTVYRPFKIPTLPRAS